MQQVFTYLFLSILSITLGCQTESTTNQVNSTVIEAVDSTGFVQALEQHLRAVSERDLITLESTLSPTGEMILILPQSPLRTKAVEFMDFHLEWFQDTTWTFKTKILQTDIQPQMGIAIVEALYQEPERDGKPYFNRMHVSYALRKDGDRWFVVKDHASSVEKSTDGHN